MPAKQLPSRPSLEQYKKQAKDLVKAHRSEHPVAGQAKSPFTLADAQLTIAREHGFESWPKFAKHIKELSGRLPSASIWKTAEEAIVAGDVMALEALLHAHSDVIQKERPQSWWHNTLTPDYKAGDAQTIIASTHKFDTWHEFVAHQMATKDHNSEIARFEAAVDMVIRGDIVSLMKALSDHPELVSVRSKRKHRSMLLHYVGANGVEGFRQHTPENVVAITELLLDRGADVNAIADMYGGATTLGLAATSLHPKRAGVQQPLTVPSLVLSSAGGDGHRAANSAAPQPAGQLPPVLAFPAERWTLRSFGVTGSDTLEAPCLEGEHPALNPVPLPVPPDEATRERQGLRQWSRIRAADASVVTASCRLRTLGMRTRTRLWSRARSTPRPLHNVTATSGA